MRYAAPYVVTLIVFLIIDAIWLGFVARGLYARELGELLRKPPNFVAAGAFYLLYAAGVVFFAVMPGLREGSVMTALVLGAGLGLIAYGTYDLTNLAVTNGFPLKIAIIDLIWGTALTGATAAIATALLMRLSSD
jgi:uncharacterized membrane protein